MVLLDKIKTYLTDKNRIIKTSQGKFTLCNSSELHEFNPEVYSYELDDENEYFTPKSEDPNEYHGIYLGRALNLVKGSEFYDPEGILLYLPEINKIGVWDSSHYQVNVFNNISFEELSSNIENYIVMQWGKRDFVNLLEIFEPWKHWEFIPSEKKE